MTTIEMITRPTTRVAGNIEDRDEEDEDPIASISALTINVDDRHNISALENKSIATKHQQVARSPSTYNNTNNHQSSSAKFSPLRSLLGVPPSSSSIAGGSRLGVGSSNGMLVVPPSTSSRTAPAGIGGASGARIGGSILLDGGRETLPSEIAPKRKKVVLGPGCSALDWARLKSTIPSRGFRKIKPSELKLHKTKDDAWSAFNGKVYDMTPYMRFHPGGEEELMRVAGRDGTRLFMLTHSWVNIDSMIDSCVIGILVSESST